MSDYSGDHLETPTLDKESGDLLRDIAAHGGYAFASTSAQAAGDPRAAEVSREMAWEQLHSGPWHSVLPVWRDAYSMACLRVARFHYRDGEFKEALRDLDLGLIMGGTLLKKDLESAVEKITKKAREASVSKGGADGVGKRLIEEEIDMAEVMSVCFFLNLHYPGEKREGKRQNHSFRNASTMYNKRILLSDEKISSNPAGLMLPGKKFSTLFAAM